MELVYGYIVVYLMKIKNDILGFHSDEHKSRRHLTKFLRNLVRPPSKQNLSLVSVRYALTALPTAPDGRNAADEGWWICPPQASSHRTATFCNVIGTTMMCTNCSY